MNIPEDEQMTLKSLDDIPWRDHHEKLFLEWGDKAICYKWLHTKSFKLYTNKHYWFTIPVIVMSTITGAANFAQENVPIDYRIYAQMGIGGVNIFVGILTTIAQFLKISELMENYRVSYLAWDKFYRLIRVEMSKDRQDRVPVLQFLKKCQDHYDELMEISPSIDDEIIELFVTTFTSNKPAIIALKKTEMYMNFAHIKKPEICNELVPTVTFLAPVSQPVEKIAVNEENEINKFIDQFLEMKYRMPSKDEIKSNIENATDEDIDLIYDIRKNDDSKV